MKKGSTKTPSLEAVETSSQLRAFVERTGLNACEIARMAGVTSPTLLRVLDKKGFLGSWSLPKVKAAMDAYEKSLPS